MNTGLKSNPASISAIASLTCLLCSCVFMMPFVRSMCCNKLQRPSHVNFFFFYYLSGFCKQLVNFIKYIFKYIYIHERIKHVLKYKQNKCKRMQRLSFYADYISQQLTCVLFGSEETQSILISVKYSNMIAWIT